MKTYSIIHPRSHGVWKLPGIFLRGTKLFRSNLRNATFRTCIVRGHSKSTFARNSFWPHFPPLFVPVCFTCTAIPHQRTFTLVTYSPPPLSKKVPRRLWRLFRIKSRGRGGRLGGEKRIIFFVTPLCAGLGSKQKTFSNCQATYQKELCLLFENHAIFFTDWTYRYASPPPLPPPSFSSLFKDSPPYTTNVLSEWPLMHIY